MPQTSTANLVGVGFSRYRPPIDIGWQELLESPPGEAFSHKRADLRTIHASEPVTMSQAT